MELRICQQLGVSHSHFLGGKNRWTQLDRDKALAFSLLELDECPNCHTLREDWVIADEDGKEHPLLEPVWTPVIRSCPGCGDTRRAERNLSDEQRDAGAYVALTPLVEYVAEAQS